MAIKESGTLSADRKAKLLRFFASERTAWWFNVVGEAGAVNFGLLMFLALVSLFLANVFGARPIHEHPSLTLSLFALILLVSLAAGGHRYRTQEGLKPPKKRVPRKYWKFYAVVDAAIVAVAAAWLGFVLWLPLSLVVAVLVRPLHLSVPLEDWTLIPLPLLIVAWAFPVCFKENLVLLREALPPELRLTTDLWRHSNELRDRARALENAIEQAAYISDELRAAIELEREQLETVHREYRYQTLLNELTDGQAAAVAQLINRQQARRERRALVFNVAIGAVFYVAGVLSSVLVDAGLFQEQFRAWLP